MKRPKKIIKEWIELTLCDMFDEIMESLKSKGTKEETIQIIKKYSSQIYQSQ